MKEENSIIEELNPGEDFYTKSENIEMLINDISSGKKPIKMLRLINRYIRLNSKKVFYDHKFSSGSRRASVKLFIKDNELPTDKPSNFRDSDKYLHSDKLDTIMFTYMSENQGVSIDTLFEFLMSITYPVKYVYNYVNGIYAKFGYFILVKDCKLYLYTYNPKIEGYEIYTTATV